MSDIILQAQAVKKSFGGVKALKGVDLLIRRGEIHCLAGENGSGKSTLIKIISGFYTADAGSFVFDNLTYHKISTAEAIHKGIQVIYQDFSLFPNLTVTENLAFNMELMNRRKLVNRKRMRNIADTAISRIGFTIDPNERLENLGVADRQLIAIGRALLYDAKMIIMDEPTTALTRKEVRHLFRIIKNLQSQGISILFISHKLDEVFEISERYTILRNGENVTSGDTSELNTKKFSYYMTGRDFPEENFLPSVLSEKPFLTVKNLSREGAFDKVDFSLHLGEILGITGLLGSGRTDLVESLFGLVEAEKGNVTLNGKKIRIKNVKNAMNNGIGYVAEDRLTKGLFLPQSIKLNMIVSRLEDVSSKSGFLKMEKIKQEVDDWIEKLAVAISDPEQAVQTLSGGNQQKVLLSRWLAKNFKLLILNGPTVGVDIGSKYDIHKLLKELAQKGLAIIVISDDLPEVLSLCSRVLIMRNGRIAKEFIPHTSNEEELDELIAGSA